MCEIYKKRRGQRKLERVGKLIRHKNGDMGAPTTLHRVEPDSHGNGRVETYVVFGGDTVRVPKKIVHQKRARDRRGIEFAAE